MNVPRRKHVQISGYRQLALHHLRSVVPQDYTIVERIGKWDTAHWLAKRLFDVPEQPDHFFSDYTFELMPSGMPAYFDARLKKQELADLGRDASFWQEKDQRGVQTVKLKCCGWFGVLKITCGSDVLFWHACKDQAGELGFLAYKTRAFMEKFLALLCQAEMQATAPHSHTTIYCPNGSNIQLSHVDFDRIVLPATLKQDIVSSTEVFFKRLDTFRGIGVPGKRGFLFVGNPGNGKTLLCHALAKHVMSNCDVHVATLTIDSDVRNSMLVDLYEWASEHAPAMVIIEDVESLVGQTQVTRSGFLNILDGLKVERGVLTVATTNYPEKLDPALAHRPSRFDRVWRIPLPADAERRMFLEKLFADPPITGGLCESIVKRTRNWSMAYIQEIKATAVVYAVQQDRDCIAEADIERAVGTLAKQFRSGQQFHRKNGDSATLGFGE